MQQNTSQRSIKLVHVTTVPDSFIFLIGQVGYMRERGFDIHGLSSPGEALLRFAEREHVSVHAVDMPRRISPFRDVVSLARMLNLLRRIRPHIVHAHTPKGGLLGMVSAWLARVPVRIYHMRGLPFTTATGWRRKLLMWCERISCGLAHRVLCVSSSVRQLAIDSHLCPPGKIVVLARGSGNGVDAVQRFNGSNILPSLRVETRRRFNIPQEALVLGFIGRIVRDKGIIELAEAWKELRQDFPALHLMLVGPHEMQDPIPSEIEQTLHNDPRVHFLGRQVDMPPLYAVMDVLALPTYREGFPNVLLEAAGMKVPVVATQVPGCTDAVQDGVTGMLVPPYDATSLAEAIRMYLQDGELRRRHGAAARDWVLREFRPEGIWQAIYQEYVRCLAEKGLFALTLDKCVPRSAKGSRVSREQF
jgi:glycosyltransferase involved in cell wall biosynthesis